MARSAFAALVVAAAAPLLFPAAAGAYDDPAVALCKKALQESINPIDEKLSDVAGAVAGASVIISYRSSILNTAPRDRTYTCAFRLDVDEGVFVAAALSRPKPTDCEQRSSIYRDWEIKFFEGPQPPSPEVQAGYAAADASSRECTDAGMANAHEKLRADALDRLWRGTGIYPINAGDTALRP